MSQVDSYTKMRKSTFVIRNNDGVLASLWLRCQCPRHNLYWWRCI